MLAADLSPHRSPVASDYHQGRVQQGSVQLRSLGKHGICSILHLVVSHSHHSSNVTSQGHTSFYALRDSRQPTLWFPFLGPGPFNTNNHFHSTSPRIYLCFRTGRRVSRRNYIQPEDEERSDQRGPTIFACYKSNATNPSSFHLLKCSKGPTGYFRFLWEDRHLD
jgi:hypothetical protein